MSDLVKRELYLRKIRPFIDKPLIKVLMGVRRCGKSSIFMQIIDELVDSGTNMNNIIRLNMDDPVNTELCDYRRLHEHILRSSAGQGKHYVFLEEVQNIAQWERTLCSLLLRGDLDLFVSGSDPKLLSSELSTYLTGRYVSFRIQTLSFREFIDFKKEYAGYSGDGSDLIGEYVRCGGFPLVSAGDHSMTAADSIVTDTYRSIFFRNAAYGNNIRNVRRLELFLRFMIDNIGNSFSARSICRKLEKNGVKLAVNKILQYLDCLERMYLIQRVRRYDIRRRTVISSDDMYYASDVSLIPALTGAGDSMLPAIENNIVYLELLSRDYTVNTGRTSENGEVDFIGDRHGKKVYVQVIHRRTYDGTEEEKFRALASINDNYPKYVVVAEDRWPSDRDGIIQIGLTDFLRLDDL